jgi:hypothetical protein
MKKLAVFLMALGMMFLFTTATSLAGINDGLVAYYPFNGNANDESGNGNDGTVNGATLSEDRFGNADSAYSFNGIDNYIAVLDSPELNPNTITISAWIKSFDLSQLTSSHNHHMIINKEGQYEIAVFGAPFDDVHQVGEISFAFNPNWYWYGTDYIDSLNTFIHITMIFDTNNIAKIYINGVFQKDVSYNNNITTKSSCLRIGARGCSTLTDAASAFFNGIIDDYDTPQKLGSELMWI